NQHHRFGHETGHRYGIAMAVEDRVEQRPEIDGAATDIQGLDGVRQDAIVPRRLDATGLQFLTDRHRHPPGRAPKHQARMPFWAWRRFSASSNTTDCGPSMTSDVTSSPR